MTTAHKLNQRGIYVSPGPDREVWELYRAEMLTGRRNGNRAGIFSYMARDLRRLQKILPWANANRTIPEIQDALHTV